MDIKKAMRDREFPIYLEQKQRGGGMQYLYLESRSKGFEIIETSGRKPLNDSIRVFTSKGMVAFWLRQLHTSSAIKGSREVDFLAAYQRVRTKSYPVKDTPNKF